MSDMHWMVRAAIARVRDSKFEDMAAPQAIDAHLADAKKAERTASRHVKWLEDLQATRLEQVADGSWPPEKNEALS
jgi:hypothetical protein